MRRKQMIMILLMSVVLVGCGNGDKGNDGADSVQNIEVDGSIPQDVTDDIYNEADDKQSEEGADENGSDDVNIVEAAYNRDKNDGIIAEAEDINLDTTLIEGKITAFGDISTMNNSVGERELPIYCVDTQENKVALSFDAAWGAEDTQEILSILKEHNIHVTFFATGGWVESYPEDVKSVLAEGHDLGNHSENHKNMSELSNEEKEEELMSVHRKVKELTGYDMFLFRPPYGDYDNDVINVAKSCSYYPIQWDVDSLDWKNYGVDEIIETVTEHKNLGNGSIILCHNGSEYIVEALDTLINKLEEQGYEIVPISELIYVDGFHLNFEGRQIKD